MKKIKNHFFPDFSLLISLRTTLKFSQRRVFYDEENLKILPLNPLGHGGTLPNNFKILSLFFDLWETKGSDYTRWVPKVLDYARWVTEGLYYTLWITKWLDYGR